MTPLIVIPAAGASSRMGGRDKLMESVEGQPLLRRQAKAALATGCPVMVCVPPNSTRKQAIADLPLTQVEVRDAAQGMGATLRTAALFAARHAPDRPMMILLPDVPGITSFDIKSVLNAFETAGHDTPTRATDDNGRPGTPLIIPARLLSDFAKLRGDDGGKSILEAEVVTLVRVADNRATQDLDTAEDWAEWRAQTGHTN